MTLADATGRLVSSNSYVGVPSAAQRYLRITEIMYNPSPLAGSLTDPQLFEYIELKNISTIDHTEPCREFGSPTASISTSPAAW